MVLEYVETECFADIPDSDICLTKQQIVADLVNVLLKCSRNVATCPDASPVMHCCGQVVERKRPYIVKNCAQRTINVLKCIPVKQYILLVIARTYQW